MIVLTAPTSKIGRQVVEKVLGSSRFRDSGEILRVVARDPGSLSRDPHPQLDVVVGSHGDPDVLGRALEGASTVFWLVPPNPGADSVDGHYLSFTRALSESIVNLGVQRVIGVTTLGHGFAGNAGNLSAAMVMDESIERTAVAYRALCMPFFMENLVGQAETIAQGRFFLPNAADQTLLTCATRDIATVASRLLINDTWDGQDHLPVVGPDDLTPEGMAQVMSDVIDRPVEFQQVDLGAFKATMTERGASDAWAQGMVDMAAAQNGGIYQLETTLPRSGSTSFRQWCEDELRPAVMATAG